MFESVRIELLLKLFVGIVDAFPPKQQQQSFNLLTTPFSNSPLSPLCQRLVHLFFFFFEILDNPPPPVAPLLRTFFLPNSHGKHTQAPQNEKTLFTTLTERKEAEFVTKVVRTSSLGRFQNRRYPQFQ